MNLLTEYKDRNKENKRRPYTSVPKKIHKFKKSYTFVLRTDKSLTFVSFVIQDLNLNFETKFFKIGQKLTELLVAEDRMKWSTETRAFYLQCLR